jgi:hypothetical protein
LSSMRYLFLDFLALSALPGSSSSHFFLIYRSLSSWNVSLTTAIDSELVIFKLQQILLVNYGSLA